VARGVIVETGSIVTAQLGTLGIASHYSKSDKRHITAKSTEFLRGDTIA